MPPTMTPARIVQNMSVCIASVCLCIRPAVCITDGHIYIRLSVCIEFHYVCTRPAVCIELVLFFSPCSSRYITFLVGWYYGQDYPLCTAAKTYEANLY